MPDDIIDGAEVVAVWTVTAADDVTVSTLGCDPQLPVAKMPYSVKPVFLIFPNRFVFDSEGDVNGLVSTDGDTIVCAVVALSIVLA